MRILQKSISILEWAAFLFILGAIAYISFNYWYHQQLSSRRMDAITTLESILKAQRYFHHQYGMYADLATVWQYKRQSMNGFYRLHLQHTSKGSYRVTATAIGPQRRDTSCQSMSMMHQQGQIIRSPAHCWK